MDNELVAFEISHFEQMLKLAEDHGMLGTKAYAHRLAQDKGVRAANKVLNLMLTGVI